MNISEEFNLVLSGGGALGYAHVGVIDRLYQNNLSPVEIVGTSMGAIVGGIYSLGFSHHKFIEIFDKFSNIFKWLRVSFSNSSIIDSRKIYKMFIEIFGDKKLSDTTIPIKIIASNFDTGEIRIFDKNDNIYLRDAILASMSIPAVFRQVKIDKEFYADGYISANLPINYLSNQDIDTLAVDVMSSNSIDRFQKDDYKFFGHTKSIIKTLERTVRLMTINQTKDAINLYRGKLILIEPNLSHYKTASFHRYKEIKDIGYDAMVDKIV